MINEVPLPTPLTVIISPSHITNIVPAVKMIAIVKNVAVFGVRTNSSPVNALKPYEIPRAWKKAKAIVK